MPPVLHRPARAAAVIAALFAAGCAHHAPPAIAAAPAPPPAPTPAKHSLAWEDSVVMARMTADRQRIDAEHAAREKVALKQMVFFSFDQAVLSDSDRAVLDQKFGLLTSEPKLRIRVAGNCDDRGADEYNLALGQRRAAAAKRYLVDRGIDPARIDIVSWGREKPVAQGDNEQAWAMNRNDQFLTLTTDRGDD